MRKTTTLAAALLGCAGAWAAPRPSAAQLHTLEQGIVAIVHFGLNTFTDREWGYGDTPASVFDPGGTLDAAQWVAAAKAGGVRRLILVCKHHDGFCLWPSAYNKEYSVASTPWRGGRGDLVREVADAARAAGLEFAAYLSPWDRHRADYARPSYTDYFHAQWRELMDGYGPVWEVWLDGANGGTGWYGGANEARQIGEAAAYYDYPRLAAALAAHNPLAVIFGYPTGRSFRWPGNERGRVPEGFDLVKNGAFLPPEADTPLRAKWFWSPDDRPKSLRELTDAYLQSVGRSGILNLGLAPNRQGLLDVADVARLAAFGDWVRAFNAFDAAGDEVKVFDCVDLREDLTKGLRVKAWRVLADGREVAKGGQIGFRRLVPTGRLAAREVTVEVEADGEASVALALRRLPVIADDDARVGAAHRAAREEEARSVSEPYQSGLPVADERGFIDLGAVREVAGVRYLPPEEPARRLPSCRVLASDDGAAWREVVAFHEFANILANPIPQDIRFAVPVRTRFLRLAPPDGATGR